MGRNRRSGEWKGWHSGLGDLQGTFQQESKHKAAEAFDRGDFPAALELLGDLASRTRLSAEQERVLPKCHYEVGKGEFAARRFDLAYGHFKEANRLGSARDWVVSQRLEHAKLCRDANRKPQFESNWILRYLPESERKKLPAAGDKAFAWLSKEGYVETALGSLAHLRGEPVTGDRIFHVGLYQYDDVANPITRLIRLYKDKEVGELHEFFLNILAWWFWNKTPLPRLVDAVVVVPPDRARRKGFDPIGKIAEGVWLENLLGIPIVRHALRKVESTRDLRQIYGYRDRRRALGKSIRADPEQASRLVGYKVLILDDIVTTGATANSCARALLDVGQMEFYTLAIGRSESEKKHTRLMSE